MTMKKILVAEDDTFLANAYRLKLTKAAYEVRVAKNGEDAFTILQEFTPDLIILDLMMPVMDGFAFLEKIKKDEVKKNIPILAASNLSQPDDVIKATKLGAVDYIIKSDFSMKEIVEKVKKYIG